MSQKRMLLHIKEKYQKLHKGKIQENHHELQRTTLTHQSFYVTLLPTSFIREWGNSMPNLLNLPQHCESNLKLLTQIEWLFFRRVAEGWISYLKKSLWPEVNAIAAAVAWKATAIAVTSAQAPMTKVTILPAQESDLGNAVRPCPFPEWDNLETVTPIVTMRPVPTTAAALWTDSFRIQLIQRPKT